MALCARASAWLFSRRSRCSSVRSCADASRIVAFGESSGATDAQIMTLTPEARGLIAGITRGTTRAHIARATLEAIAYEVRDVVDLMSEEGGVELERLAIDGGAAANDLLCQMQADQLRIPVDRSAELQTTGVGAAFLAGLGVGMWKDIAELQHTRTSSGVFEPHTVSDDGYRRWRRAVERSKGWAESN